MATTDDLLNALCIYALIAGIWLAICALVLLSETEGDRRKWLRLAFLAPVWPIVLPPAVGAKIVDLAAEAFGEARRG